MPHFYFHIRDKGGLIRDERGADFDSLIEAHQEAIKLARSVAADMRDVGDVVVGQTIEVSDRWGNVLESVPLRPR